ncbi:hypothetical protein [Ruegeria sp.]|uniref:hypothetical protein n=1 Tax=Ruegeria sp. TaxID=1879320 RepID=UPI003C7BB1B3
MARSPHGNSTCIHHRGSFFVGLGHPRCGTGFTASLISKSGLDVGHEIVGENGIISWMLPGEKYRNPFHDAIGPLNGFAKIFLVARSPFASIPSIVPENRRGKSLRFRRQVLRERLGTDPIGGDNSASDVVRAVASYVNWFELCLTFKPKIIFRVDRDDNAILSDFLDHAVLQTGSVNRNSRPEARGKAVSPEELVQHIPDDLLSRLLTLSETLGYSDEVASVRNLQTGK